MSGEDKPDKPIPIKKMPSISGEICSVVGCTSRRWKNPDLKFYSFPGKPWEVERRKKWIIAIRRVDADGKPWQPAKSSKICSLHFEGGKKSEHPHHPAYYPTIFPAVYGRKVPDSSRCKRWKRLEERNKRQAGIIDVPIASVVIKEEFIVPDDEVVNHEVATTTPVIAKKVTKNVGVQTDYYEVDYTDEMSYSSVWQDSALCEVSIQTCIFVKHPDLNKTKKIVIVESKPDTRDARSGPETPYRPGFVGYTDEMPESEMKNLTGIGLKVFKILLDCVKPNKTGGQPTYYRTLNAENRLLLFLMKMRLGVNIAVLGALFRVAPGTASNIFKTILVTVHESVKNESFKKQCELIMPSSAPNQRFTREEVVQGHKASNLRINIEQSTQLSRPFDILSNVSSDLLPFADQIADVAVALANAKEPSTKKESAAKKV